MKFDWYLIVSTAHYCKFAILFKPRIPHKNEKLTSEHENGWMGNDEKGLAGKTDAIFDFRVEFTLSVAGNAYIFDSI